MKAGRKQSSRKKEKKVVMDRISSLPHDIIHDHIFRFLPNNKDIKVMSCLSKTWYHLSNSFPYLDFDRRLHGLPWESEVQPCKEEVIDKYVNYVGQTLQKFHNLNNRIVIRRLDLPMNFRPRVAPLLDNWIELVLQHGVEDFNLYITDTKLRPRYNLPPTFFAHPNSTMIKEAAIMGCNLLHSFPIPKPNPNPTNLLMMKKLHLHRVMMVETTFSCIISRCPLLEELYILHSTGGIKNCLRISNLEKLKALVISDWEGRSSKVSPTIEIDAPSLESIHIQVIGEVRFNVGIIGYYPILTELTLEGVVVLELEDVLSRLPLLRSLTLLAIPSLRKLKVSSDTLNDRA